MLFLALSVLEEFTLINIPAVKTAIMFMKGETDRVVWQPKS